MNNIYFSLCFLFFLTACEKQKIVCHKVKSSPSTSQIWEPAPYSKNLTASSFREVDRTWIDANSRLIPDAIENLVRETTRITICSNECIITNTGRQAAVYSVNFVLQTRSGGSRLQENTTASVEIAVGESHIFKNEAPVRTSDDVLDVSASVVASNIRALKVNPGKVLMYTKSCFSCDCNPDKDQEALKGMEYLFQSETQIDSLIESML